MKTARKKKVAVFDQEKLRQSLITDAKVVGIPEGAAEAIAVKIVGKVSAWVGKRTAITSDDLNRCVATEAKRYSADLAYVYQNRGKII